MRRGELWWADFGEPFGSEPGYRRPVLVVQADSFNNSRIGTTIVVPLTTNLAWARAPGNVVLRSRESGLRRQSVANVSQLTVVDRKRLVAKIGTIPGRLFVQVEEGLRLVLEL